MGFPRAPRKRVSNTLKIVVAPPASSQPREPDPVVPTGQDFSSHLQFKAPRGFKADSDIDAVISRQEKGALDRLAELQKKARKCCHSKVDGSVVGRAREAVRIICAGLRNSAQVAPSLVLGHQPDTSITLDVVVADRRLVVVVWQKNIDIGKYQSNTLVQEDEVTVPTALSTFVLWVTAK
jgi:hypothetical protein